MIEEIEPVPHGVDKFKELGTIAQMKLEAQNQFG